MLGGGQTKKLKRLPDGLRLGDNLCAIPGGIRLWEATISECIDPSAARQPVPPGAAAPSPALRDRRSSQG